MPSTKGPEVQADDKLGKITLFSFGIGIVSLIASGAIGQSHNDQWGLWSFNRRILMLYLKQQQQPQKIVLQS